jgi:bifunctional UDP-N-acetylglucosamine pyrophosphorylase/glucosamine-1-phosphate N-acetyltransferase
MKAVILAAGLGTRLGMDRPKSLVKIGNRTLIEYLVEKLRYIDINDIAIVIRKNGEEIKEILGDDVNYFYQEKPLGTAHAVLSAKNFINEPFFLTLNGDIFFTDSLKDFIRLKPPAIAAYSVEDTSKYGRLYIKSGRLVEIKEKIPERIPGLVNAGIYIFPKGIFNLIKKTPLSERKEYEITDTIKMLINQGIEFKVYRLRGYWKDIATREDLEEVKNFVKDRRILL